MAKAHEFIDKVARGEKSIKAYGTYQEVYADKVGALGNRERGAVVKKLHRTLISSTSVSRDPAKPPTLLRSDVNQGPLIRTTTRTPRTRSLPRSMSCVRNQ